LRHGLPADLIKARNVAIVVSGFEFLAALLSASLYEERRSRFFLFMTILNVVFVAVGLCSKLSLSYCGLIIHSMYMISVIGGFYIYIMIDFYLRSSDSERKTSRGYNDNNLSETTVMMLTSSPLMLLFIMGCYSLVLLLKVDYELEARAEIDRAR